MSIGGFVKGEGRSRKIELTDLESDRKSSCQIPNFPVVVSDHETVQTQIGVITCGGLDSNNTGSDRCYKLENNYSWTPFPSMHKRRSKFSMYEANGTLFAVGGRDNASSSLEWITLNGGNNWTKEDLPFSTSDDCITKFNSTHLIKTGGWLSRNKRIEVVLNDIDRNDSRSCYSKVFFFGDNLFCLYFH